MQSHACYCHWHSAVVCNHGFLYAVETWPTCAMQSLCMQICINRRASTCYWFTCSLEIQKWVTCSHISFNCHFHFQLRICRIYCVLFFVSSNQWQKISRKRYMRLWKNITKGTTHPGVDCYRWAWLTRFVLAGLVW